MPPPINIFPSMVFNGVYPVSCECCLSFCCALNIFLLTIFAAEVRGGAKMALVGELKQAVVESLVCVWSQWTQNKLLLKEAKSLVRKLLRADVLMKDGELGGAMGGRGKRKQEALDCVLQAIASPLDLAMLHRDNPQIQMLSMRDQMLTIVRATDGMVEVWREEVAELQNWLPEGGAVGEEAEDYDSEEEVGGEGLPVVGGVEVEQLSKKQKEMASGDSSLERGV